MDIEGLTIHFLRLKMNKNRPFFVWGPFSETIFWQSKQPFKFSRTANKRWVFFWNKTRFNFENRSTGTIRLLSLKTSCWSCVITYSRKPLDCKIFQLPRILKVLLLAQLVHLKTCHTMNQESEKVSDRELFSELLRKPDPLAVNQYCTSFCKQKQPYGSPRTKRRSSSKWREVCGQPSKVFAILQSSIVSRLPISAICSEACWKCVVL